MMAETSRAGSGLPEEIVFCEILVRLPPKFLLRCRAVCRAWHRATSAHGFLLAHHARQPKFPLTCSYNSANDDEGESLEINTLDHRSCPTAAYPLEPVARLTDTLLDVEASCDGLLVLSHRFRRFNTFSICNPVARQYAPLPQLNGFNLLGMYQHTPTGEYRLLLYWSRLSTRHVNPPADGRHGSYVFALGSCQPPRHIGCQEAKEAMLNGAPLVFRGSLHWYLSREESGGDMILVFDTTTESWRHMRGPDVPGPIGLFEMDGVLGITSFSYATKTIDIWMMQDYEVWAYKCHVKLPIAEEMVHFPGFESCWIVVATSCDGDVLFLVQFGNCLLQVDMDGKLIDMLTQRGIFLTQLPLKQSLVSHTFFSTLEGYVVNVSPFT